MYRAPPRLSSVAFQLTADSHCHRLGRRPSVGRDSAPCVHSDTAATGDSSPVAPLQPTSAMYRAPPRLSCRRSSANRGFTLPPPWSPTLLLGRDSAPCVHSDTAARGDSSPVAPIHSRPTPIAPLHPLLPRRFTRRAIAPLHYPIGVPRSPLPLRLAAATILRSHSVPRRCHRTWDPPIGQMRPVLASLHAGFGGLRPLRRTI